MPTIEPAPPVYLSPLEIQSGTVPVSVADQYRKLVTRLIKGAHDGDREYVIHDILALAYPSGTAWPHRRDMAEFERAIVTRALDEASENTWCNDVHDALYEALSPVWRHYPNGVSPLFINEQFHHPETGLAWDGAEESWHVNCRREDDTKHCSCGHECTDSCRKYECMTESRAGHHFHSTDSPQHESCIRCGAMYTLMVRESGMAYYVNARGESINDCSTRTDLVHGYERVCEVRGGRECLASAEHGTCEHTDHECDCLLCG